MIYYKDLSAWLKASVICTFIMAGIWAISFLVGLVIGIIGVEY